MWVILWNPNGKIGDFPDLLFMQLCIKFLVSHETPFWSKTKNKFQTCIEAKIIRKRVRVMRNSTTLRCTDTPNYTRKLREREQWRLSTNNTDVKNKNKRKKSSCTLLLCSCYQLQFETSHPRHMKQNKAKIPIFLLDHYFFSFFSFLGIELPWSST